MKVYVTQSKSGIMMNVGVNVKNKVIEVLIKIICGILVSDCECNKACKIDEYLDIKNCSCKKLLLVNYY